MRSRYGDGAQVPWMFTAQLVGGLLSWPLTLFFWRFADLNELHHEAYLMVGCEADLTVSYGSVLSSITFMPSSDGTFSVSV